MSNPFMEDLKRKLQENPEHCYVTNTYIAALMGDGQVLVITGDFEGATPEQVNQKIVDTINQITKK
jgi:hypothetical protein